VRSFKYQFVRKFPPDIQQRDFMKLSAIGAAPSVEVFSLPLSKRLEILKGQHSIRIKEQWKIWFVWRGGELDR